NGTQAQANTWAEFQGASSTTFTIGNDNYVNANTESYIAYLFAEVPGFSRFGSYTGNGNTNGPFVWCGFRPRWIMAKRIDNTSDWFIWDALRPGHNTILETLFANSTAAEVASSAQVDITS